MFQHEAQVRSYFSSLEGLKPKNKDGVRSVLLERKLECLLLERSELRSVERRAVTLIRRVDWDHINPKLVHVAPTDMPLWIYCRKLISSAPWSGRPGRANFFFCVDQFSKGILGIVDLGSDMQSLAP